VLSLNLLDWFEKGMTFSEYQNSMQVNQEQVDRVYEQVTLSEDDLTLLKELAQHKWKGVVLTADWCGDAALNVPIVQKVAEVSGIELHYLIRDDNLELMDQYLTNGKSRSIPIFIFFDETGKEAMVWGPRAHQVEDLVSTLRAELPPADSTEFEEAQKNMYRNFKETITTDPTIWRAVIDSVMTKIKLTLS
jgi:cyanate lyase